jgi:cytochrome c2
LTESLCTVSPGGRNRGSVLVRAGLAIVIAAAVGGGLAACTGGETSPRIVPGGDPGVGRRYIEQYGCGTCHTIPGVKGATALVGPPLTHWSRRSFIAGQLPNTPDNLVRWITNPQLVEPGTAMPNLRVTPDEARNIAAYLVGIQ